MMAGRRSLPFGDGNISRAMLNFQGVIHCFFGMHASGSVEFSLTTGPHPTQKKQHKLSTSCESLEAKK